MGFSAHMAPDGTGATQDAGLSRAHSGYTAGPAKDAMRILFLVSRDFKHPAAAGGDVQVWDWASYLASKGHEPTIVCMREPSLPRQETVDGVRIVRLGAGCALSLKAALFYIRNRKRFDVVYDDVIGGGRAPFLAPIYVRKPVVGSFHQVNSTLFYDIFPRPVAFAMAQVERALALLYRGVPVRAPSEASRQDLHQRLGLPLERVHVIPASIPNYWFQPVDTDRQRPPLIVWIGKFRPYKYVEHLLEAMPQVLASVPAAKLVLVGRHDNAQYEQALAAKIAELGLSQRVEFRFGISEEEKRSLLCEARVLALPSHLEGFGIVVLEANACGVPVVASSGVPETAVRDGYNGLRHPFGDVDALARQVVRVLTEDQLHRGMASNGLAFARQFEWSAVGAEFETLLGATIDRKAKSPARSTASGVGRGLKR